MKGRPWTRAEQDVVRRFYRESPAELIGEVIGRSKVSVHQQAERLGLVRRRTPIDAALRRRLRALHAQGWSDSEIETELRIERHTVSALRCEMGLPSNRLHPHQRGRVAEKTREQLRRAGLTSMAQLRVKAWRDRAIARGWPEDLPLPEQRIVEALYEHGPMTRKKICATAGFTWKQNDPTAPGRGSLCGGSPMRSYLGELMRRELVVYSGRKIYQGGQGRNVGVYSLALSVAIERSTG